MGDYNPEPSTSEIGVNDSNKKRSVIEIHEEKTIPGWYNISISWYILKTIWNLAM